MKLSNSKRFSALVVIGCLLAVTASAAAAVTFTYLSNAVVVTVEPSPSLTLTVDHTNGSYDNGESIVLTATLYNAEDRDVSFMQDGVVIGTATSVGGVAHFTTTAVNDGATVLTLSFSAGMN